MFKKIIIVVTGSRKLRGKIDGLRFFLLLLPKSDKWKARVNDNDVRPNSKNDEDDFYLSEKFENRQVTVTSENGSKAGGIDRG